MKESFDLFHVSGDNNYGQLGLGHRRAQAERCWESVRGLHGLDIARICIGGESGSLLNYPLRKYCNLSKSTHLLQSPAQANSMGGEEMTSANLVLTPFESLWMSQRMQTT